jgi:hypothetical protein
VERYSAALTVTGEDLLSSLDIPVVLGVDTMAIDPDSEKSKSIAVSQTRSGLR